MSRNTFDVLNERDLSALLRDHMNATALEIADALFNGPKPLINVEQQPWSLTIALEVVAARAAETRLPKPALMLIVGRALGMPTVGIRHGDSPAEIGAALAREVGDEHPGADYRNNEPLCSQCDRPTLCKVIRRGSRPCNRDGTLGVEQTRPVDRSTLKPGEPIRVVRASQVADAVMKVLAEHPLTQDAIHDANGEEAKALYESLTVRVAALIGEGVH